MASASSKSARHALVRGLRLPGDERQLTNAIAAIASDDITFATAFVDALLSQVHEDCLHTAAAQERLLPVPRRLRGDRERQLYDRAGGSLGRVDLIFEEADGESEFTLLVENKLYSQFGPGQLDRYHAGLRVIRGRGGRGGLIAVTRDVPTGGELKRSAEEWLGSIRWARLLPKLRNLPIEDAGVAAQWLLLLDVLDDQGDLGMTGINADAVRAWARAYEGREALASLLKQVARETVEHTQRELRRVYRIRREPTELARPWYRTVKESTLIQSGVYEVRFGIRVPADYKDQTLQATFWTEDGKPFFGLVTNPRDGDNLLDEGNKKLQRQVNTIVNAGFVQNGSFASWYSQHDAEPVLTTEDAPSKLLGVLCRDITTVIESRLLLFDVTEPLRRGERHAKRAKKATT